MRDKLEKIQCFCGNEGKTVLTSVIVLIELSQDVLETKCDNAKLVDGNDSLKKDLEDVQPMSYHACVKL